jgi:probable F420-dependent oxidoreductase
MTAREQASRAPIRSGAMKFSVWPSPTRPPAEILDLARLADAEGWHGLWFADHYMPNTGSEAIQPGDMHECWAMLPAIAAVTERIRLGSLVAPTSIHHPAVLANRAATIDHVSNGRLVLGIGAGWQINEHLAYGIELEPPVTRVDRFEEAIQIIRSLCSNERTTFAGTHYTVTDAPMDPKPVQSPLPILVGTSSPRMLRITAAHADEWNTWGAPELAGANMAKMRAACDRVERDPATMRTCAQALVIVTDDQETVDKVRAGGMAERTVVGSIDRVVDEIGAYAELGFDEFIVPDFTFPDDTGERNGRLTELFADLSAAHG